MVDLDTRSASILKYIIKMSEPVTAAVIARNTGLSLRAVHYRMRRISAWLHESGVELKNKPNYGVLVLASNEKKEQLFKIVNLSSYYSQIERIYLILFKLITSDEPLIIKYFEVLLSTSRSTIVKDMEKSKEWLGDHGLILKSKPNFGFWVEGDESDIREGLLSCILNSAKEIGFHDELMCVCFAGGLSVLPHHNIVKEITNLFHCVDFRYLNSLLNTVIDLKLSDRAQFHFILRLGLMINRLKKSNGIRKIPSGLGDLKQLNEYFWSEFICRKIAEKFQIQINIEEITSITRFLIDAQISRPVKDKLSNFEIPNDLNKELIDMTDSFLCHISRRLNPSLAIDAELRYNLVLHLNYFMEREDIDHLVDNPVIQEIKTEYSQIFPIVNKSIRESRISKMGLNEDEIGYLTIHIAAALERLRYNEIKKKKILIVCNAGMASALLLKAKFLSEFPETLIEKVISYQELLEKKDFSGIDLIISTIPLSLCNAPPVLVVNVILKERDFSNLKKVLVVQKKEGSSLPKISLADGPRLSALIDNSLIALKQEAVNWEDACLLAGSLLYKSNIIEKNYISAMVKVVREFGPYMVAWPGVAMVHAECGFGSKQAGMSLVTLKTPVDFGHLENDPVDIIVALSIPQGNSIALALDQLNTLLTNVDALQSLRSCDRRSSVMMLIKKFCDASYSEISD